MNDEQRALVENNVKLIYYLLNKYYPSLSQDPDVQQTGMVALCKAAKAFEPQKGTFATFAYCCLTNEIRMMFRHNKSTNSDKVVSFDNIFVDDLEFGDIVLGYDGFEEGLINKMDIENLNLLDRQIVFLLSLGYSQAEIAKMKNLSQSWVSRLVIKIRSKLSVDNRLKV